MCALFIIVNYSTTTDNHGNDRDVSIAIIAVETPNPMCKIMEDLSSAMTLPM